MRIIRHFNAVPREARGAAIAVGNFDGLHLGHRAVIGEAGKIAHAAGIPWAVLTFEPHPRTLFQPNTEPFRVTPFRTKVREIAALGVEFLVVLRFDRGLSERSAESFVTDVLVNGLGARHVVSGYDFVFGHRRQGNCELLLAMGRKAGFDFTAVHPIMDASVTPYSATRVRSSLKEGDPKRAAALLGRPFEIEGRVVSGDRRGRLIGFPTANIPLSRWQLRPKLGVYAVRVGVATPPAGLADAVTWYDGVANFGIRPMFPAADPLLEVFLFNFDGDLYDRRLRVRFVDFLRPEKKFDGLEELKAQIVRDSDRARDALTRA